MTKFEPGERVRYVGYPVESLGVVTRTTEDGYSVKWENKSEEAFFFWQRWPGEIGRVEKAKP